jgi:hypothetical protein
VQFEGESLTPSKCRHLNKVLWAGWRQITKAVAVETEIKRLQTEIDNCTRRKNRRKFRVQHGGVIRVADAKDILKAKTKADKLQVETRAQRQAYIAEQKAKIKSAEYWKDTPEAGIMVTVFVLIRVTILRTNRNPLKGASRNNYTSGLSTWLTVRNHGLRPVTVAYGPQPWLTVRNRGLRSATVTSNYGRAVTIPPTLSIYTTQMNILQRMIIVIKP